MALGQKPARRTKIARMWRLWRPVSLFILLTFFQERSLVQIVQPLRRVCLGLAEGQFPSFVIRRDAGDERGGGLIDLNVGTI
jgi:hypothetical protein